jgi:hypothetical protein
MNKELSFKQILESEAYAQQKEIVFKEINKTQTILKNKNGVFAPASGIPSNNRVLHIDYKEFKKSPEERAELATIKAKLPKTRGHEFKTITKVVS